MQIAGSGANLTPAIRHRTMRSLSLHLCCSSSAVVMRRFLPAAAQSPPRPPKPYAPVAITRPAPSGDESFIAFRAALAAAAKTRVYAELAPSDADAGLLLGSRFRPAVRSAQARGGQSRRSRSRWSKATASAGSARDVRCRSRRRAARFPPGRRLRPGGPGYRRRRLHQAARQHLYDRHRLGLSARGQHDGSHRQRTRAQPSSARLGRISSACSASKARTANRPRPQAVGARRHAGRQDGLCRPRQPDIADSRTPLLHQGRGRLADCRIYRGGTGTIR